MTQIRLPAVANSFYPGEKKELKALVDGYLASVRIQQKPRGVIPKAMIVPHAGYVYSGPIAASAYASIKEARGIIQRVVLIGTAHWGMFPGLATSSADAFSTPLGTIFLDKEAIKKVLNLPQVQVLDEAHQQEHSLEVELPFLQEVLGDFKLVPLVVSQANPEEVSEVLEMLWGGAETLIVVSSDLSHYQDYETAKRMDEATSHAIETLAPEAIGESQACGRNAINGMLVAARKKGLVARTIDLRNSGDTAGSQDRVVGYGAYLFEAPQAPAHEGLSEKLQKKLLRLASDSIDYGLRHGIPLPVNRIDFEPELRAKRATFVTLRIDQQLRGCIGTIRAHRSLVEDVAANAFASAFYDPRFRPLNREEFGKIKINISILTEPEPMLFVSEADLISQIRKGVDGLIIEEGEQRGTLLPSVWDSIESPADFLNSVKLKAGLPEDYWSDTLKVKQYTTESF